MKRSLRIIIPIVLIAGICALTCPNKQQHTESIQEAFTNHLEGQLGAKGENDPDAGFRQFSSHLGGGMMKLLLQDNLTIKNYGVCSIGKLEVRGKSSTVSVGVLNTVFTVSFDKIQKQIFGF